MRETKLTRGIEELGLEKAEGDVFVRCYGWGKLTSTRNGKPPIPSPMRLMRLTRGVAERGPGDNAARMASGVGGDLGVLARWGKAYFGKRAPIDRGELHPDHDG